MKTFSSLVVYVSLTLTFAMVSRPSLGQSTPAPSQLTVGVGVPRLLKLSGQLKDASGTPLADTVGVMFAIYSEQTGGVPLWQETQNVQFSQGSYTVFLGNSTSTGIPAELFASGQSQWLGLTLLLPGETEQPRILLASVPYALKAVDADTLGGIPASSYVRANTNSSGASISAAPVAPISSAAASRVAIPAVGATTGQTSTNPAGPPRPAASGAESGTVSLSDSTSASYAFRTRWTSPPICTLTPTSDPHAIGGYWVTSSTSSVTVNAHYPGRITFNFRCQ